MSTRVDGSLQCSACRAAFPYHLIHDGFNVSAHGYCHLCGRTLVLDLPSHDPRYSEAQGFGCITLATESKLAPCQCGGQFRASASPRCPSCGIELSAVSLGPQIEANAVGTKAGWRWQNSWQGLYAIIIGDNQTTRNVSAGA
jgi:hypothetical protein